MISRENRVFLALWRRTSEYPEGFTVKLSNRSLAISTRQGLYRAVKPFRGVDGDPVLSDAADKFVVSFGGPEDNWIVFRPRKGLSEIEAQFAELGITEADLASPEERAILESGNRLAEELSKPIVATPFYTRD